MFMRSSLIPILMIMKKNSVALVRKQTIPIELQPLVEEGSANVCG
jgi:hypothetical protein